MALSSSNFDYELLERIDRSRLDVERMYLESIEKDRIIRDLMERLRIITVAIDMGIQLTS